MITQQKNKYKDKIRRPSQLHTYIRLNRNIEKKNRVANKKSNFDASCF